VSDAEPATAAWLEFRDKWFESEPDARVAQLFFPALRELRIQTLLTLEHEFAATAFAASDADVALAKLGWWAEELHGLSAAAPRHPLSGLLDAGAASELARAAAAAGRIAALESVAQSTELIGLTAAMTAPFTQVLARQCGEPEPGPAQIEALAAVRVVRELARWRRFVAPGRARVPLDLLARHRLTRGELAADSPSRSVARLAEDLLDTLIEALADAGRACGVNAARLAAGRVLAAAMRRQSADVIADRFVAPHWRSVWALWRVARAQRGRA
jgi:phytoene synthase